MSADVQLRALLRHTADSLLAYFERRVSEPADAADLLSETMIIAWRRVDNLPQDAERQRMWLFTIAANVLANGLRSRRRAVALGDRLKRVMINSPMLDLAELHAVRDAVADLPRSHRELVMLIHWDGFTITEAAKLLDLNPSTARSRYAAARSALREALTEQVEVAG